MKRCTPHVRRVGRITQALLLTIEQCACYPAPMTKLRASIVAVLFFGLAACNDSGEEESSVDNSPAAPTDLTVVPAGGGAHVTWTDNSDNEDEFVVMRKDGTAEFQEIASVPFDTVQYHDEPVTSGTSYTYMVMAVNADGESHSDEVVLDAP
jgi:hypothetical protein